MVNASKTRNLIRDSWKDAAIYGLMADIVDDPERVRRFKRLQEIQTTIAVVGRNPHRLMSQRRT